MNKYIIEWKNHIPYILEIEVEVIIKGEWEFNHPGEKLYLINKPESHKNKNIYSMFCCNSIELAIDKLNIVLFHIDQDKSLVNGTEITNENRDKINNIKIIKLYAN